MRTVDIQTPDDLIALVRECAETGVPLVDYGVAHQELGHPPPPHHVRLRLHGTLLEHHASDFAVRIAGGARFGDVQMALAAAGQFLPIDADDDLTIAEIINHNVYGPLRIGYGSVRDLLLGLGYIDGLGQDVRVGGRTLKNVAGYDVARLMIGSLGELGVIHEATLRTFALPEQVVAVDVAMDDPRRLDQVLTVLLSAEAAPARLALAWEDRHWVVRLGYLGRLAGCSAQVRSLETVLQRTPGFRIVGTGREPYERYAVERAAHRAWRRQVAAVVKIVVPPASTGTLCKGLRDLDDTAGKLMIGAMPAHGCIFAGGDIDELATRQLDCDILDAVEPMGGFRVWYRRPAGCDELPPFAPPQADWGVLADLKRAMDPRRILNPGRFLPLSPTS